MRLALALLFVFGCEKDDLSPADGGANDTGDAGVTADSGVDAGTEDSGAFPCDPTSVASPEMPAAITGAIEIVDYDYWDTIDGRRGRVRNAGINFLTGTLPPVPLGTAALFPGIPIDQCEVVDILLPMQELGPARNVGVSIELINEGGDKSIVLQRMVEADGIRYRGASQQDTINFFDPAYLAFDEGWTYRTDGDSTANIRGTSATLAPFDDFTLLSPAVSSSSAAVAFDGSFTWTSTGTKGLFSILLGKALNTEGDARYAVCHADDDGSFSIPPEIVAEFAPTPGLAFDVVVSRASVAPFCNEGVTSGLILHVLAYLGAGVVP